MLRDQRGIALTGADHATAARYETALHQLVSYVGDPLATLEDALAERPDFIAGRLTQSLILLTRAERRYHDLARQAYAAAEPLLAAANPREQGLARAIRELLAGDLAAASLALDHQLMNWPRDLAALAGGHLVDFYRGDAANLRNRISRVLPHWGRADAGYSFVLGMHAFGLEEMNQYAEAEDSAHAALSIEPRDGWAVHAGAHVMEMTGRIDEGIAWLESREPDWAPDNAFAFHNWWHLALFYLDGGEIRRVLELYDRHIVAPADSPLLTLIDRSALLWRLHLEGVELGPRMEAVADEWQACLEREAGYYAFNDYHAALAFAATGRHEALADWQAQARRCPGGVAQDMMAREVGQPLTQAFRAFGAGEYGQAIGLLERTRPHAQLAGGSHAQRDVLSLTLVEAALRAGDASRARHYLGERLVHKPASRWAHRLLMRAGDAERGLAAAA
jgi:tetratricopeptide (TPR) repeat protein